VSNIRDDIVLFKKKLRLLKLN